MIRRRDNPNIIITQTAHSWLAGQFAMHWGNQNFQMPALPDGLILAAINHDLGWAEWEQTPELNDYLQPIDFLEMPVPTHLHLWQKSINIMVTQNHYTALLISRHARFLIENRLAQNDDPEVVQTQLRHFCTQQQLWETKIIRRLQDNAYFSKGCQTHNLEANLRLLQVFDWLSLLFCMSRVQESVIVDVPAKTPNTRVEIRLRPIGKHRFTILPWPFNCPHLVLTLEAHHLKQNTFESNEHFQATWQKAEIKPFVFEVIRDA